jgi:hypothetical protein
MLRQRLGPTSRPSGKHRAVHYLQRGADGTVSSHACTAREPGRSGSCRSWPFQTSPARPWQREQPPWLVHKSLSRVFPVSKGARFCTFSDGRPRRSPNSRSISPPIATRSSIAKSLRSIFSACSPNTSFKIGDVARRPQLGSACQSGISASSSSFRRPKVRAPLICGPPGLTRSGTLCLIRPLSERTYHTCTSAPADTIDGCKSA